MSKGCKCFGGSGLKLIKIEITRSCGTEGVLDVGCHAEGHVFGHPQLPPLLEADVVVDVHHLQNQHSY